MNATRITVALSVLIAACHYEGEEGNVDFELRIADRLYEFESGDRVLLGTHMCPHILRTKVYVDETCYSEVVSGPALFDADHCWTLDTPGAVVWEVNPTNLVGCDPAFLGDRITIEAAAPSESLRLGFDDWQLRATKVMTKIFDYPHKVVGLEPGQTLDDFREDPESTRRVIAGQLDMPLLRLDDEFGRVYFGREDVSFELIGQGAKAVQLGMSDSSDGELPLMLQPEAVALVRAEFPGDLVLESPPLIAVPPSDAASLDLLVMVGPGDAPAYAHARVRDAKGRVLHAAPVEWSVSEGALPVHTGDPNNVARTGEYAVIEGTCEMPSETDYVERHAVLRASYGTLEDSVELTWFEAPRKLAGTFEPDEACLFGEGVDSQ